PVGPPEVRPRDRRAPVEGPRGLTSPVAASPARCDDRRVSRTVVVTGASSGIGEACALHLAASGWRVRGGGRAAGAAGRRLRRGGGLRRAGIEPLLLDVTDAGQIEQAADAVGSSLDGLVDNAGIAVAAPLEVVPLDELRRQLEVNVVGQVAVLQALLPALRSE